jgi:hypothetical protein
VQRHVEGITDVSLGWGGGEWLAGLVGGGGIQVGREICEPVNPSSSKNDRHYNSVN